MAAYEKLLKSVLDDRTLTDAEARLIMYLAARPPGWTVYPELLSKELKRSLRHWVLPTLKLLHARGLVAKSGGRVPGAPNMVLTYRLIREVVIEPPRVPDLGSAGSDITSDLGPAGSVVTDPVVTDSAGLIKRTDCKRELTPSPSLRSGEPPKAKRGTRIPADFREQLFANKAAGDWFRGHCPGVNVREETDNFFDHWTQRTGGIASKLDWVAAWRNWMREEQKKLDRYQARPGRPNRLQQNDQALNAYLAKTETITDERRAIG